jgi:trimethylamine:corrinoid methyltransferase-like protein
MNRDSYDTWVAHGSRDLATRADTRVAELLAAYTPPDDLDELTVRQLREYCLA